MKRNAVSLTMAAAMLTGMLGSVPAFAADLSNLPDKVGEGTITATPDMYPDTDLNKPYTVNMYLIGDTPNDWDMVEEKINEYLEPFNTQIETTFMSWSDYNTMYTLVLAGGEQVDLIFTAPWCYMYTEAAKGSFYDLSEDFINTYMPLAAKYQAPESWDDYKQYMLTIAEKETPESGIYALAASGDNNELWDVYRQQTNTMLALDSNYMDFIYEYKEGELPKAEDIKFVYEYEPFRQYAHDMKEMADAGCWSRSALTNTVTDDDAFGALQGASIAWNASVFTYMKQAEKAEGVECMAYDLTKDNLVNAEAYSNNDMAITAGSENPERAAMVLDLLKFDTTLNRLLLLGIEGVHYSIDDQGNYTRLDKTTDYAPLGISAAWATKNGDLEEAGTPERELAITDAWKERVVSNPTITFVFDDASVKPYEDAVISILNDYVPMLELGLVDDVDATIDEMVKKCYDAGLQNVMDEFTSQYNTWLESR